MEKRRELEWAEAQKIKITQDLVVAAKQQLKFLAQVEKTGCLYDGPVLSRAVHRYKYCWLPLLAEHDKPATVAVAGPLVVPLDCEWIWHCHRLNPVQYKNDSEELYGRILDNKNTVSSISGFSSVQTEAIWRNMFPDEPYELDLKASFACKTKSNVPETVKATEYDLISAVKRQSSFFYQVWRPHMSNDLFLEEAVSRYKGFLYLIKRNYERSIGLFCVPTYDIDLVWHAHQLHPVSYCKDLMNIMGKVLEHDDTDSDRSKGQKLDVGFSATTKQWETTFGSRYWRAGAMYRCNNVPYPLKTGLTLQDNDSKKGTSTNEDQSIVDNPLRKMIMEVMLEIIEVRGLPAGKNQKLAVTISKKEPDILFNYKKKISISSQIKDKNVAFFQCEPVGEFVLELLSYPPTEFADAKPGKLLGTLSIPLQDLSEKSIPLLAFEKWFKVLPQFGDFSDQPINIQIALSFTPLFPALEMPYTFNKSENVPNETNVVQCEHERHSVVARREIGNIMSMVKECCNYGENPDIMSTHCGGCGGCRGGCGGGSCGSCGGGCGGSCHAAKTFSSSGHESGMDVNA